MGTYEYDGGPFNVWGVPNPGKGSDGNKEYHPNEARPRHGLDHEDRFAADPKNRAYLAKDNGFLSVAIKAGDANLGEIYVSTQFEVRPGDHPACVANHEAFTGSVNEWLKSILDELLAKDIKVKVSFDEMPSTKYPVSMKVERAVAPLVGPLAMAQQQQQMSPQVEPKTEARAEHRRENQANL